ncbi:hypothetical protein ABW21_db0203386 [Orbilia brochopaga]|nr:hypothetical protein ABW21_db0203386 [Drechslerella brochopaga]
MDQAISPIDERLQHLRSLVDGISQLQTTHAVRLAEQNVLLAERAESQRISMERSDQTLEQVVEAMALLETRMTDRIKVDEESRLGQIEMQVAVRLSTDNALDAIRESMQSLSSISSDASSSLNSLVNSISQGKELMDDMNTDFDTLSAAHERISSSLRSQQTSSLRHLSGMDLFVARLNDTLHDVFAESARYLNHLEASQAQFRMQRQSPLLDWNELLFAVHLPLFISFLVLVNRKRSAIFFFIVAFVYACCLTYDWTQQAGGASGTAETEEAVEGLLIEGAIDGRSERLYQVFRDAMGYIRGLH